MIACLPPTAVTLNPPAVNVSPTLTAVAFRPTSVSDSATFAGAKTRRLGFSLAAVTSRSASTWSKCSCVISTSLLPTNAASSAHVPGSMRSVLSSFSMRTQACVYLISCMPSPYRRHRPERGGTRSARQPPEGQLGQQQRAVRNDGVVILRVRRMVVRRGLRVQLRRAGAEIEVAARDLVEDEGHVLRAGARIFDPAEP